MEGNRLVTVKISDIISKMTGTQQFGLFASTDIPKSIPVCKYEGRRFGKSVLDKMDDDKDNTRYILKVSKDHYIDAVEPTSCLGRYINDKRGTGKTVNVKLVINQRNNTCTFRTTRKIKKNEELFWSYGRSYWNVVFKK